MGAKALCRSFGTPIRRRTRQYSRQMIIPVQSSPVFICSNDVLWGGTMEDMARAAAALPSDVTDDAFTQRRAVMDLATAIRPSTWTRVRARLHRSAIACLTAHLRSVLHRLIRSTGSDLNENIVGRRSHHHPVLFTQLPPRHPLPRHPPRPHRRRRHHPPLLPLLPRLRPPRPPRRHRPRDGLGKCH